MEQDRYQHGPITYTFGMICLVLSMGFFVFSAYLAPNLLIGLTYNLPEFIAHIRQWFVLSLNTTDSQAGWYTFFIFFGLGLATALLAFLASNKIDNHIYKSESISEEERLATEKQRSERIKQDVKDTANIVLKVFLIVIAIICVIAVIEWLIYIPPAVGG